MISDPLGGLTVFLAVAEHRSFTGAADALEVSPTAVSKAIRQLEQRHGVVLFQRTTRSVALTEAGTALYQRVRPAATEITDALASLAELGKRPVGILRLTMSRPAMMLVIEPIIAEFRRTYPEVTLDLSLDEGTVDLTSGLYDAGIRQGESVEKDMVAVRLTPELRWCVVGSPGYLERAGRPSTPGELHDHKCLLYRFVTSGQKHRWEFDQGGREVTIDVPSGLIVNDRMELIRLAVMGLGLAYVGELEAAKEIGAGQLVPVLQNYITPSAGLFLYFPARTQHQPKLRVLIDVLRRKSYHERPTDRRMSPG
jgi:DNA-binding transcriptional LysR family regulator